MRSACFRHIFGVLDGFNLESLVISCSDCTCNVLSKLAVHETVTQMRCKDDNRSENWPSQKTLGTSRNIKEEKNQKNKKKAGKKTCRNTTRGRRRAREGRPRSRAGKAVTGDLPYSHLTLRSISFPHLLLRTLSRLSLWSSSFQSASSRFSFTTSISSL